MKMKFNQQAAAAFSKDARLLSHGVFVAVSGLSVWGGSGLGIAVGVGAWLALQFIAIIAASIQSDAGDDGGGSG